MPSFTPVTPGSLVVAIADRAAAHPGLRCVAISGADASEPVALARPVADHLRGRGRPADVVDLHDYVRPASLRFEHGRTDPHSYRWEWFDYDALDREVLRSFRERGRWLPRLWDESTDRSARVRPRPAADDQVLIVAGPMLLGRGLGFDLSVTLVMSRGALDRRTGEPERWTIPVLLDHDAETEADLVVRYDHPDRPALRIAEVR
ncbi:hypothetical protein OED52_09480 [Rhodococcus sp. Z13]|uniref:Uncharacterized protein n=1 Tax=Rhodococcus sacchari TaxID=2962047 RepID=A0ACD4DL46_9NOCA|nr:hypothetical protein [Rhodococcus sp. Z13]UYP20719.1 hypothetical protein OED52_09480 [Rhodococcus sp. Z13]